MIKHFLSFEKQIADLEGKIEELRHLSAGSDINIAEEIGKLQGTVFEKLIVIFLLLTLLTSTLSWRAISCSADLNAFCLKFFSSIEALPSPWINCGSSST